MFLNRIERLPEFVATLEKLAGGLDSVAEAADLSLSRLRHLKEGNTQATPAEEWALVGLCENQGLYPLLADYGFAPPPYNRHRDFDFRSVPEGASFRVPDLELRKRKTRLLGHDIDFPIGIPACALTPNHEWLRFFADRGFCILTHKTVRRGVWNGHEPPHWGFVRDVVGGMVPPFGERRVVADMEGWPRHPSDFSMVNSFGVPSLNVREWQDEIQRERGVLGDGTMLIVSIMGTPEEADRDAELINSFVETARFAREAGAPVIEANLSCPNTKAAHDDVYANPQLAAAVMQAIRKEVGASTPLIAKIGYLNSDELEQFVRATHPFIDGIVAINTIRMPVTDSQGEEFFHGRSHAGVSGTAIKELALEVVGNLARIKDELKPELVVLGVGGVTTADDVDKFLASGADAALSCTGAWMNPLLAIEARLADRVNRAELVSAFGEEQVGEAERVLVQPKV